MKRLRDVVARRRARAATRRKRALPKAVAEMKLRQTQEGSIWKSGKGGSHYDR